MVPSAGPDKYSDVLYNFLFRPHLIELFSAPDAKQMEWMLDELSSAVIMSRQWTITDRLKQIPGFRSSRGIFVYSATARRYSKVVFLLSRSVDSKSWLMADVSDDGIGLHDSVVYSAAELMSSEELVTEFVGNGIHLLGAFESILGELVAVHADTVREYEERLSTVKETLDNLNRVRDAVAMVAPNPLLMVPRRKPVT